MKLQGCFTAIVTPFAHDQVDVAALRDLVAAQIDAGVDGIVPVGTTGESPTLSFDEHPKVIEAVVDAVNGRCKVIAGTGANATEEAVRLTQDAARAGADATLQVTPYYNKPTSEGLFRHFSKVADDGGLPVVLYNVPGRSAVEIDIATVKRLANHNNVIAIKEAGGSVDRVSQILSCCQITVLSGDDTMTFPMMALGASGVISVASNIIPQQVCALVHAALAGNWDAARQQHYRLYQFFRDLFLETNPIPIKAAMAMTGRITEEYRLPLCPMQPETRARLKQSLIAIGVEVCE